MYVFPDRYYVKNKRGRIVNAPYVDCSYKYAGGGLLSTVEDLARFGNAMLYSYQNTTMNDKTTDKTMQNITELDRTTQGNNKSDKTMVQTRNKTAPGYLKSHTMEAIWTPVPNTQAGWAGTAQDAGYGMGWAVIPKKERSGTVPSQNFYVSHTGGAIGASSVLLVLPSLVDNSNQSNLPGVHTDLTGSGHGVAQRAPQGVVVAMITNMQAVGLNATALKIAKLFQTT